MNKRKYFSCKLVSFLKINMISIVLTLLLLFNCISMVLFAQKRSTNLPCDKILNCKETVKPQIFTLVFNDSNKFDNVVSLIRLVPDLNIMEEQKIRIYYKKGNQILDTITKIQDINYLLCYDIGGGGQTIQTRILPSREFTLCPEEIRKSTKKYSYIELLTSLGYGGKDKSTRFIEGRKIGFNNFYYNFEIAIFPFSFLFGDHFNLGFGSGILIENNRARIPLKTEINLKMFSPKKSSIGNINYKISDPCFFGNFGSARRTEIKNNFCEIRRYSDYDSVYIYPEIINEKNVFPIEPYIFFEGGYLFNLKFSGSNLQENIINSSEKSQYFYGGGLGLKFWNTFVLKVGYKYLKLNIATNCPGCNDAKVINSNLVNSLSIFLGLKFNLY